MCFVLINDILRFMTYWCGVALQLTVNLAEVEQIRLLHVTSLCPGSVQDRCGVALQTGGKQDNGDTKPQVNWRILISLINNKKYADLWEHKAVVTLVTRVICFVAHGVEEEHRHELCCTAAWCGVTEGRKTDSLLIIVSTIISKEKTKCTHHAHTCMCCYIQESSHFVLLMYQDQSFLKKVIKEYILQAMIILKRPSYVLGLGTSLSWLLICKAITSVMFPHFRAFIKTKKINLWNC